MKRVWPFLFLSLLITGPLEAKRFTNQYCEFELPGGWECALEGTEYVCQSVNKNRQKEAIIILAAKSRGTKDSLAQYQSHLKKTKTFTLPGGRTQVSAPKYTKQRTINNHVWVDSLHLASEIPGFYTRYLATVKADLGVAVTFSVARDNYDDYKIVFDKIIESLKVFRQNNSQSTELVIKKTSDNFFAENSDSTYIPPDNSRVDISQRGQKGTSAGAGGGTGDFLFFLMIALAVGAFLYIRKRRK